jgi:hypothetical protein
MSIVWQNAHYKKVFLTALGMVLLLATSSPQTAEVAAAYLAQRGYTEIIVKAPKDHCGRGPMLFTFHARSNAGKHVAGELSVGNFAYLYRIKLQNL